MTSGNETATSRIPEVAHVSFRPRDGSALYPEWLAMPSIACFVFRFNSFTYAIKFVTDTCRVVSQLGGLSKSLGGGGGGGRVCVGERNNNVGGGGGVFGGDWSTL